MKSVKMQKKTMTKSVNRSCNENPFYEKMQILSNLQEQVFENCLSSDLGFNFPLHQI